MASRWPVLASRLKSALSIVLIAAFGMLATGCGTASGGANGPIPIRIWRLDQGVDPIRDILTQYEKNNPNVAIDYDEKSIDTYEIDALSSLAARTGPEIWSIPNDWLGDHQVRLVPFPDNFFYPAGSKTGLSPADTVKKVYPAGISEQLIGTDGKVYGLPTNVDTLYLYYNPAFFSDALTRYQNSLGDNPDQTKLLPAQQLLSQPPTTWDQLLQQIPYLTQLSGSIITTSAIAMGTADNVPAAEDTLQLLMMQNGADITNTDRTRATFADQQTTPTGAIVRPGEKALDFYASFSDPNQQSYSWNATMPDALDAFAQGKVGMVLAYTDFAKQLQVKYPQFELHRAPVPQISTTQPPVNIIKFDIDAVTKAASSQLDAAKVLFQYANTDGANNMAQEAGLKSPFTKQLQADGDAAFGSKQILTGRAVWKKSRVQFDAAFRQMIIDVSQNGATSAAAVDQATKKITDLLSPPAPTPSPSSTPAIQQ